MQSHLRYGDGAREFGDYRMIIFTRQNLLLPQNPWSSRFSTLICGTNLPCSPQCRIFSRCTTVAFRLCSALREALLWAHVHKSGKLGDLSSNPE